MALNIDPEDVSAIRATVEKHPNGATLNDIIAGFSKPVVYRTVQRWVREMGAVGLLRVNTTGKSFRYFVGHGTVPQATGDGGRSTGDRRPTGTGSGAPVAPALKEVAKVLAPVIEAAAEPRPASHGAQPAIPGWSLNALIKAVDAILTQLVGTSPALLGAIVAILAVVGGGLWYWLTPARPPTAAISEHLVNKLAPLPVRVAALDTVYITAGSAGCQFQYTAGIETTEPLYRRVDTAEYLRTHFAGDVAAITAANALLAGSDGPRLRAAVASDSSPPESRLLTPFTEVVLLSIQTLPAKTAILTGVLQAYRSGGIWMFTGTEPRIDRTQFAGEPKPAGAAVFVVDLPDDAAKLKALVTAQATYAAKVQTAATALAAELERDRRQQAEAYAQLLRPGTMFVGTAMDARRVARHPVALEVTASSAANNQIAAGLHNELWYDTRPFKGTWTFDAAAATVTLRTGDLDAISAGPILIELRSITVVLRVLPDGAAAVTSPADWELQRVDAAHAALVKAEFLGSKAAAGVEPGAMGQAGKAGVRSQEAVGRQDAGQTLPPSSDLRRAGNASSSVPPTDGGHSTPDARVVGGVNLGPTARLAEAEPRRQELPSEGGSPRESRIPASNNPAAPAALPNNPQPITNDPAAAAAAIPPSSATHPPSDQPVNGSTGALVNRSTELPAFPTAAGAYVLVSGRWTPLPRNNGRVIAHAPTLAESDKYLQQLDDFDSGKTTTRPMLVTSYLTFDGKESVPMVPGQDMTIVYVGLIAPPSAAVISQYPELKEYPLIELAPTTTGTKSARQAPLFLIAPNLIGFGPKHIPAAEDRVAPDITVIRCLATPKPSGEGGSPVLPRGRYALFCGPQSYEVAVQ